jgi:hypothetical protein
MIVFLNDFFLKINTSTLANLKRDFFILCYGFSLIIVAISRSLAYFTISKLVLHYTLEKIFRMITFFRNTLNCQIHSFNSFH